MEPDTLLEEFRAALADFYIKDYGNIYVSDGTVRSVADDNNWLRIRLQKPNSNATDYTPHQVVSNLQKETIANVAVVIGHPGSGKTTIVKKIATDWASHTRTQLEGRTVSDNREEDSGEKEFYLLLVISAKMTPTTTNTLLECAINFYINHLDLGYINGQLLLQLLEKKGGQVLVCLDGFDEQVNEGGSWNGLLSSSFDEMSSRIPASTHFGRHKTLITSRPYACDVADKDLSCTRYLVCSLEREQVKRATSASPRTEQLMNVLNHKESVSPLMISLMYELGETSSDDFPEQNLTKIYEYLVRQMLKREGLTVKSDNGDHMSEVFLTTAKLAFVSCTSEVPSYAFTKQELNTCGIIKASFIGGLLHHCDDGMVVAKFPTKTLQQYFAAVYLHHMIHHMIQSPEDTGQAQRNLSITLLKLDSFFGRFLFGTHPQKDVPKLIQWWDKQLEQKSNIVYAPLDKVISGVLRILRDLPTENHERVGQTIHNLITRYSKELEAKRSKIMWLHQGQVSVQSLSHELKTGLRMESTASHEEATNLSTSSYEANLCIRSEDGRSLLLAVVQNPLNVSPTLPVQIVLLPSQLNYENPQSLRELVLRLPNCGAYVFRSNEACDIEAVFLLTYPSTKVQEKLPHCVSFTVCLEKRAALNSMFPPPIAASELDDQHADAASELDAEITDAEIELRVYRFHVKVKKCSNRSTSAKLAIINKLISYFLSYTEDQ